MGTSHDAIAEVKVRERENARRRRVIPKADRRDNDLGGFRDWRYRSVVLAIVFLPARNFVPRTEVARASPSWFGNCEPPLRL
jgi:hypothetical protein